VVPNGVELEQFPYRPERPRERAPIFTYIGMLSYAPNADALDYFVTHIWPLIRSEMPEARFRIVGRCPPAEVMALTEKPGVELIPDVPEILPYFHDADALLVPLRAGSGTRLKIIEALASGCPVVTTSLGCEGLEVRDGDHLFIADNPAEFARRATWLARHPDAVRPVQARGRQLVEEHYTWERIGQHLRDVYQRLSSVKR
jgi:glycosyltransferase involved in cell wall biosynthesis